MVEVLVVLTILGIALAIAAPRMNTGFIRVDGAVQEMSSALYGAHGAAVARQHDVVVAFDVPGRRVRLHYDQDNDGQIQEGERVRWIGLPDRVAFGAGPAGPLHVGPGPVAFSFRQAGLPAVVYHRNGSASEEGGLYLHATRVPSAGPVADVRALVVERGTGRVTAYRFEGGEWVRSE